MRERENFGDRRTETKPVVRPLEGTSRRGPFKFFDAIRAISDRKFVEKDIEAERRAASNWVREYAEPADFTVDTRGEKPLYVSPLEEHELDQISAERKHARSILKDMEETDPNALAKHYDIVRDVDSHRRDYDEHQSLPPGMREE